MKNSKVILYIIAVFLSVETAKADGIITMFLKPFPLFPDKKYCEHVTSSFSHGTLSNYCVFGILDQSLISGIFATYGGYLYVSNQLGQITFPYKHTAPKISLVITTKMTPIFMGSNTIHHWELNPDYSAAMFSIERKQDPTTKLFYWDTKAESLPKNQRVPLNAIVILAKPQHVYVPVGITPTLESPHLILPEIYIKKGINLVSHALYMLNLKHLFGPVKFEFKKDKQGYRKQII